MWFQFNALQWGEVLQTINVSDTEANQGVVTPAKRSASLGKVIGKGKLNGVSGSSSGGSVGGSS